MLFQSHTQSSLAGIGSRSLQVDHEEVGSGEQGVEDDYIVLDSCSEQSSTVDSLTAHLKGTRGSFSSRGRRKPRPRRGKWKRGGAVKQQQPGQKRQELALRKIRSLKTRRAAARVSQAREVKLVQNRSLLIKADPDSVASSREQYTTAALHGAWPTRFSSHTPPSLHTATADDAYSTSALHRTFSEPYGAIPSGVGEDLSYRPVSGVGTALVSESQGMSPLEGDLRPLIQRSASRLAQDELFLPPVGQRSEKAFNKHTLPFSSFGTEDDVRVSLSGRAHSYNDSDDLPSGLLFGRPASEPILFDTPSVSRPSSAPNRPIPRSYTGDLFSEQPAVGFPPVAKRRPLVTSRSWRGKRKKLRINRLAPQANKKINKGLTRPLTTVRPKPPGSQSTSASTDVTSPPTGLDQAVSSVATQIQQTLSHPSLQPTAGVNSSDTTNSDVNPLDPQSADARVAQLLAAIDAGISSFIAASKQITDSLDSLKNLLSER